jgi:hypothetical protein
MHVTKNFIQSAAGQAAVIPADALHGNGVVVLEVQGSEEGSSASCSYSAASEAAAELDAPDNIDELAGNLEPARVVLLRFECLSGRELKVAEHMHACYMHAWGNSCRLPATALSARPCAGHNHCHEGHAGGCAGGAHHTEHLQGHMEGAHCQQCDQIKQQDTCCALLCLAATEGCTCKH